MSFGFQILGFGSGSAKSFAPHDIDFLVIAGGAGGGPGAGGGGGGPAGGSAGAGGKGVVILSVPTANYSGTTSGSPTITTSGSNTILQFNGDGTYTV